MFSSLKSHTPDEVYNLAGQSFIGLSFEQPVETMESIAGGTLNLLEAIRFVDHPIRFYNAGSSECFGDTGDKPANESTPFHPRSPYAHYESFSTLAGTQLSRSIWHICGHRHPVQSRITAPTRSFRNTKNCKNCCVYFSRQNKS